MEKLSEVFFGVAAVVFAVVAYDRKELLALASVLVCLGLICLGGLALSK